MDIKYYMHAYINIDTYSQINYMYKSKIFSKMSSSVMEYLKCQQ